MKVFLFDYCISFNEDDKSNCLFLRKFGFFFSLCESNRSKSITVRYRDCCATLVLNKINLFLIKSEATDVI